MTDAFPNSAGSGPPALAVPALACDAHIHVYDRRFAFDGPMVDAGTADDYRRVRQRLGTARSVVVTPRIHGVDNAVTLDAIAQLGADRTRGVAVLRPDVTDAELRRLHDGGVRGIRFTLYVPAHAAVDFGMVEPLARRVHGFGWHVQLHWSADQVVEHAALLRRLPTPLVFDHLARLPLPAGTAHPAFDVVRGLVEAGRAWVKLSGPYLTSALGAQGGWHDVDAIARAWVRLAPERLVWGSDWPHPTEPARPDDAALLDLLNRWVDDDATRRLVLVDNPARLYGFS